MIILKHSYGGFVFNRIEFYPFFMRNINKSKNKRGIFLWLTVVRRVCFIFQINCRWVVYAFYILRNGGRKQNSCWRYCSSEKSWCIFTKNCSMTRSGWHDSDSFFILSHTIDLMEYSTFSIRSQKKHSPISSWAMNLLKSQILRKSSF